MPASAAVKDYITMGANVGGGGYFGDGCSYYIRNYSWSLSGVTLAFVPNTDQSSGADPYFRGGPEVHAGARGQLSANQRKRTRPVTQSSP